MKRSKKFLALALLVPTLITAACGSGGEQAETAETGAETAETADLETIGAGADGTAEPGDKKEDSGTEDAKDDNKADGVEKTEGERVLSNKDLYIYLTNLELDDNEGTAYLHLLNRTEDSTISITMEEVRIDGRESEWQSDGVTLAGGESGDTVIRFSKPDFGGEEKTLSECAYIKFGADAPGLFGKEDAHVSFYVKGDKETAEAMDKAAAETVTSDEISIEAQELYNADGISVFVPEQTVRDDDVLYVYIENLSLSLLDFGYDGVTVNGVLLMNNHSYVEEPEGLKVTGGYDMYVDLAYEGDYEEKLQPDVKSGEIGFTLVYKDSMGDGSDKKEVPLTLEYTRND